jgi:hypothetical protein
MRNKLQYVYSIAVFFGVLVTTYLMMSKDPSSRTPYQSMSSPSSRIEASMVDPAVTSLFEAEDALTALPQNAQQLRRALSGAPPVRGAKKRKSNIDVLPPHH